MATETPPRPAPIPDFETQPYWDAAARSELMLQRCVACGTHRHYPRALCPSCHADTHDWVRVSGQGRVYSFSIVRRAPSPAFAALVPYVVALIALDEGPHLLSHVVGVAPESVRIDMPVTVAFEEIGDGVKLPVFRPI